MANQNKETKPRPPSSPPPNTEKEWIVVIDPNKSGEKK